MAACNYAQRVCCNVVVLEMGLPAFHKPPWPVQIVGSGAAFNHENGHATVIVPPVM